jgi:hypothetical protein
VIHMTLALLFFGTPGRSSMKPVGEFPIGNVLSTHMLTGGRFCEK